MAPGKAKQLKVVPHLEPCPGRAESFPITLDMPRGEAGSLAVSSTSQISSAIHEGLSKEAPPPCWVLVTAELTQASGALVSVEFGAAKRAQSCRTQLHRIRAVVHKTLGCQNPQALHLPHSLSCIKSATGTRHQLHATCPREWWQFILPDPSLCEVGS